jgi:hypothetical protein
MELGDTFVLAALDKHLWVICSDPCKDHDNVVIINFTTYTIDEEDVCILDSGDHDFINHKTAMRYRDAKAVKLAELDKLEKSNMLSLRQRASASLMQKVWLGASLSVRIPIRCMKILLNQSLLP